MKTASIHAQALGSLTALLIAVAATGGCSGEKESARPETEAAAEMLPAPAEAPIPETALPYDALPESARLIMDKPFTEDFDGMVKRRMIRAAVTFNRTHYFIDQGQEKGLAYESLKQFESDLNADLKTKKLKVHVVIVPMSRDQLYPALESGKVDLVAAMVTVTPEREKLVAFSEPTRTNVSQVVVTGPGADRQKPRRRDRGDADHAADRKAAQGRRHFQDRAEHPCRRQVHAVHDGRVFQGRAHG